MPVARRSLSATFVLLAVLVLTGCSYVNIGDSVGMPGAGRSYVDELGGTNYAVPGARLSDVADRLEQDAATRDAVANSTMLTISAGGNDVMFYAMLYVFSGHWTHTDGGPLWVPEHDEAVLVRAVEQIHADWQRMADDVVALQPKGRVIVLTIYNPYVELVDATARRYLVDLNIWIAAEACARGWLPARVDVAFNGPDGDRPPAGLIGMDGLHPSEAGQHTIVEAIAAATCG